MNDNIRYVVITTDYSDPFPLDELLAFRGNGVDVYVVEVELGNDSINWVFSDQLVDEVEATQMAREYFGEIIK